MTKNKPTIAITGAGGFLGSTLIEYFAKKNWNVIGLVRQPGQQKKKHANVTYKKYDITRPLDKDVFQGVDYVVHAAYIKFDKANPDALDTNLDGAKRLVKATRASKVKRTIFISTMSAHEDAFSVYGKQKLATEKLFDSPKETILKPGLIIGNGGIVKQMSDFMKSKHMVPLIAGGRQPLQIVAVQDLVRVIDAVFEKDAAGIYVVATPKVYSYKQFYQALAKRLNLKILYVPVPYWTLQSAFQVAAVLRLPLGVGEDNLKGLKALRVMESKNGLRKLGVTLLPLDKALNEVKI
jgi:nucleoside-diphosphate-sugar epimerase